MDWGATIVFILSIIGAVILSGGDVMVGIIAFLVIFCILAAIKGVVKFIASSDTTDSTPRSSSSTSSNAHIILDEEFFVLVHDQVIKLLQAYSSELPDEWYHYFISQEVEHIGGGTTEGYLKFQVMLGNWWDGLLYSYPEVKDYMMSIFTFDASENTFTYRIRTGTCSGGSYPRDKIAKMVHKYLDNYESTHSCVHLKREDYGAKYSNL